MDKTKDLIIVTDHINLALIAGEYAERCDFLAMTPAAMLACEENRINYRTFDDLYDYRIFRADNLEFLKDLEDLFSDLDAKYQKSLGFPHAFSGNILWFITFFDNLLYLSRVCEKIRSRFAKVYIAGSKVYNSSLNIEVKFSQEGLAFHQFNEGLINRISMVRAYLNPAWLGQEQVNLKYYRPKRAKEGLLFKIPRMIGIVKQETALLFAGFLAAIRKRRKGSVFVIQGAYEVRLLKRFLPEFKYIYPAKKLLGRAAKGEKDPGLEPFPAGSVRDFVNKWFAGFADPVERLFVSYHNMILVKIPGFLRILTEQFERYRPKALFYAICANKLYEFIFAYMANKRGIPVFYFQHGGFLAFYRHPFLKYTEHDRKLEKINIFQSQAERRIYADQVSDTSKALGSIKLYDLYRRISRGRRKSKKVLYCTGPFNFYNYRDLMTNVADKELFEVNKDIISALHKQRQETDIKVHPNGQGFNQDYFRHLIRIKGLSGLTVLKGGQAENILENYGLLILDYIGSALVPAALVLDIPVIIYLKDISYLTEETFPDLEKAFYLVRDKTGLEERLEWFKKGRLKTKFSSELLNNYIFPTAAGNPATNIADFIRVSVK